MAYWSPSQRFGKILADPLLQNLSNFSGKKELLYTQPLSCKKSFAIFPSPAEMSLTKLSLAGFLVRQSLVSDISAGDGKMAKLFLQLRGWVYKSSFFSRKIAQVLEEWISKYFSKSLSIERYCHMAR